MDTDVNDGGGRLYIYKDGQWVDASLPGGGGDGGAESLWEETAAIFTPRHCRTELASPKMIHDFSMLVAAFTTQAFLRFNRWWHCIRTFYSDWQ